MSVVVPVPHDGPPESPRPGVSVRRILRFLAAIAALCAVCALPASAMFDLQSVSVVGNSAVGTDDVLRRAGIGPGVNAFQVDAGAIRQRLLEDPRVDDITVTMASPLRLTIVVRERPPVAALVAGDGFVLVGKDAVAITQVSDPGTLPALIVDRLAPAAVPVGTMLSSPDVRLGTWIAGALPPSLKPRAVSVHVDGGGEATLDLRDGPAVRLGGTRGIANRLSLLPQVLDAIAARKVRVESIDLRFPGSVVIQPVRSSDPVPGAGERQENPRARGINPAMHRPSNP